MSGLLCVLCVIPQIPAMAVEMPGSTDISGLNLQFGALQFGSEPVLPEYDSTPATTTPDNQVQNSLYTSPSRFVSGGGEPNLQTKLHRKIKMKEFQCLFVFYLTCHSHFFVCKIHHNGEGRTTVF